MNHLDCILTLLVVPYSGSFTVKALHQQGARRGQTDTRTYHIGGADGYLCTRGMVLF